MKNILQKFKKASPGEALTADWVNSVQDAIIYLAKGGNLRLGKGFRKGQTDGEVTINYKPPRSTPGGGSCTGFIVSVDGDGEITATESNISHSGPVDTGFTVPTWVDTSDPLPDGGGTVPATGTILVWVKYSYSAVTVASWGTAWELTDVEFDFGSSMPADVPAEWDETAQEWDPSTGTHYSQWATIQDRKVTACFGGGIVSIICNPGDIRIVHGCTI